MERGGGPRPRAAGSNGSGAAREFDCAAAFAPRRGRASFFALALTVVLGCGRGSPPDTSPQPPLVVVAVDGLEWDVLLPLVRAGRLPHLAALMERGSWGLLETFQPTLSPVVWTTIATGKSPAEHGIAGFTLLADGERRLYQSGDRRTKAIWNIASEHEKRVAVIGWWASWPAEAVNGVCVTQRSALTGGLAKGGLLAGLERQVFPPERGPWVQAALESTEAELDPLRARLFGVAPEKVGALEARLYEHCLWSVRADRAYARLAAELLAEEEPWDFLAVYLGSPDVIGHRFWRYRQPELFEHPPGAAAVEACGDWIERNAVWIDEQIGELARLAGERANLVVLSDHGMRAWQRSGTFAADAPLAELDSGHHLDAPPGVFVAAGPSVRRSGRSLELEPERLLSLYDVLPTWLAWLDVPIGRDMRGEVCEVLVERSFLRGYPPRRISTHEQPGWRSTSEEPRPGPGELERMKQLSDLGYLGIENGE